MTAGPVISTGVPGPAHAISSSPPRVCTPTGDSSSPRRMPATTAAQAQDERGRVLSSTPVIQQVAVPQQVCQNVTVREPARTSGAGAVMGAIAVERLKAGLVESLDLDVFPGLVRL